MHLVTDAEGAIQLGDLQDVTKLTVDAKAMRVGASWFLSMQASAGSCRWKYPEKLELLEDEELALPVNLRPGEEKLSRRWFSCIRSNILNDIVLEDLFDQVVLKEHKGYHTFVMPNL